MQNGHQLLCAMYNEMASAMCYVLTNCLCYVLCKTPWGSTSYFMTWLLPGKIVMEVLPVLLSISLNISDRTSNILGVLRSASFMTSYLFSTIIRFDPTYTVNMSPYLAASLENTFLPSPTRNGSEPITGNDGGPGGRRFHGDRDR